MPAGFEGRARRFGDDINTDYIIASTRKRDTLDASVLKRYLLETVDPGFAQSVQSGDILVAGRNFGCGSAMEVAATVILAAGIPAVLAQTFSRTFFRNAVNNGLLPVTCDTTGMAEGHRLTVVLSPGNTTVVNVTTGDTVAGAAVSGLILEILEAGGLVPYLAKNGGFALRNEGQSPIPNPSVARG